MKWLWISLAFVLAIVIIIIMKTTRANGDHVLNLLDGWKNGLQKKIAVIDERQKKREKLIKIMEKYTHELDKDISRMSDDDLDKYINAFR